MLLKTIKICGITDKPTLQACIDIGVGFIGFNFVQRSPRYITLDDAVILADYIPNSVACVALVVNETDLMIEKIITHLQPDYIQLHGTETVNEIRKIKQKFDIKIIKAIPIANKTDIETAKQYADDVDIILYDAKPVNQNDTVLTGGHGHTFDWTLLSDMPHFPKPIMLAGGLNYMNLNRAKNETKADYFDICSGVEESKGKKSVTLIKQLHHLVF
jgi:phosphoribosylanthranilate isomerase